MSESKNKKETFVISGTIALHWTFYLYIVILIASVVLHMVRFDVSPISYFTRAPVFSIVLLMPILLIGVIGCCKILLKNIL